MSAPVSVYPGRPTDFIPVFRRAGPKEVRALFGDDGQLGMAKAYEGDYEFGEAGRSMAECRGQPWRTYHPSLRPIREVFERSIERTLAMHILPIELVALASHRRRLICMAQAKLGLPVGGPEPAAVGDAATDLHFAVLADAQKNPAAADEARWLEGTGFIKSLVLMSIQSREEGIRGIEPWNLKSGIEAMLAAMLLSAYAAFETLAGDTWIALVNADPMLGAEWCRQHKDKSIKFTELGKHGLDLSKSFGTYLDAHEVSFLSFAKIKAAYESVFGGTVGFCFDRGLYESEKIRHLIAHRGGLIDQQFKREMREFPVYQAQSEGSDLILTGPMVSRITGACVRSALALLRFAGAHMSALAGWCP